MNTINSNSMMAHQTLMDITANNVANVNTDDFQAKEGRIGNNLEVNDAPMKNNLAKNMVDELVTSDGYRVQVPAIKTQDEMTKSLLDIKV